MINLGQGHLLTLASLSSIHTFQRSSSLNCLANQSEILCEASMGRGDESLVAKSRSHDQDGRQAHIWYDDLDLFYGKVKFGNIGF